MINKKAIIISLSLFLLLMLGGVAAAAELINEPETYTLEAGQVVDDDLYVVAQEVIIEGTVTGDLVALSSFVRIKGTVQGDALVVAWGILIDEEGTIEDDARLMTTSTQILGRIGDDVFAIGGGNSTTLVSWLAGNRTLKQGVFLDGGSVGGNLSVMAELLAIENGTVGGDLDGQGPALTLKNANVEGDGRYSLNMLEIDEQSRINGANGFTYSAVEPLNPPSSLSDPLKFNPIESQGINPAQILVRILGAMAGFALLGWFILRFRPNWLYEPATALNSQPLRVSWIGFGIIVSVPFVSLALVFIMSLFWGFGVGFAFGLIVFCLFFLVLAVSPLIVGFWLGLRFNLPPFQALLIGTALLVMLTYLPIIGSFVTYFVFLMALGALVISPRLESIERQV